MNFEQDIICPECCNIQLLGLDFNEDSDDINNFIDLYSYCIYNHKRNNKTQVQKNNLNDIFSNNKKSINNIIYNKDIICESCNKKLSEYHCLDCKRNICKNCFDFHKSHKYYCNYDYISERELKIIEDNLVKTNNKVNLNFSLIQYKILVYEQQLNNLKKIYEKYKEINEKLTNFSLYILNKYRDLSQSQKPINYPIYFNLKNTLLFQPMQLVFPYDDISINSFTNILTKKFKSGLYFTISNSLLSTDLDEYNKTNKLKTYFDINNINDFTMKKIDYDIIKPIGEDKLSGITLESSDIDENQENQENKKIEGIEIYNIKNQTVDTRINSTPDDIFYNEKYNIILLKHEYVLEIYNFRDFTLIQEILIDDNRKRRNIHGSSLWNRRMDRFSFHHEFTYAEFISENTIGFVYEGALSYLGQEIEDIFYMDESKVINVESDNNEQDEYSSEDFSFFIVYQRENKNANFLPKSVSILVKMAIFINEIPYKSGEDDNLENTTYCKFEVDSITKITDEGYIIAFKSRIKANRNQRYFYITDKFYKNETIYYYLDWKNHRTLKNKIGATKEKSHLFKNDIDNKYYFIYNISNAFAISLKKYFEKYDLNLITINVNSKLNITNLYIEKQNVFGWNRNSMYIGKIISGELEIIYNYNFPIKEYINFISLKHKYIYYQEEENNIGHDDSDLIED